MLASVCECCPLVPDVAISCEQGRGAGWASEIFREVAQLLYLDGRPRF